jgi:predicted DNA binding CopG/RHH family protein
MKDKDMLPNYDFSKGKKNPYAKILKKAITIRIEEETILYFKNLSEQINIPYQSLINMYLADCAKKNLQLSINWEKPNSKKAS